MKLSTKQDIEAPIEHVFRQLTDFEQFERMAMRRGAEVDRLDHGRVAAPGMGWKLRFAFRGKVRRVELRVIRLEQSGPLGFSFDSPMFIGDFRLELLALAPRRTRLTVMAEVKPKTLAARLLIQSLRLAKGRTQRRLDNGLAQLGRMIELNNQR